jgi:hypothetical protein
MASQWPSRIAKIFERAFPLEFTPLPLPTLRLVFCSTLTHTQRQYSGQRLRGRGDGLETPADRVSGSSRAKTYGSVLHTIFQPLADRFFTNGAGFLK